MTTNDRILRVLAEVETVENGHRIAVTIGVFDSAETAEMFCARIGALLTDMTTQKRNRK